jgi:hypothetical protein
VTSSFSSTIRTCSVPEAWNGDTAPVKVTPKAYPPPFASAASSAIHAPRVNRRR